MTLKHIVLAAAALAFTAPAIAEPVKIRVGHGAAVEEQLWLMKAKPDVTPNQGKAYTLDFQLFRGTDQRFKAVEAKELDVFTSSGSSAVVAYSQGFDQIAAASAQYGWGIDRGAMARIWRGGCIIRARFLDRITEAYTRDPELPLLLADPYFTGVVGEGVAAWRRIVAAAATHGVPAPAFASSLAYYDAVRAERLPAALTQAQRDYFGAHTYQRTDRAGTFHTDWSGDRREGEV